MTKYRIRLDTGRVIGPFEKNQLFDLKAKGHIKGNEEAQVFPTGNWGAISSFDFYSDLMDENKTVVESMSSKEETFVIDLSKLREQRNEKEIEEIIQDTVPPIEQMTETIRLDSAAPEVPKTEEKINIDALDDMIEFEASDADHIRAQVEVDLEQPQGSSREDETERHEKTLINPVAQQEIEALRRRQQAEALRIAREEEAKRKAEEDAQKLALVLQEQKKNEVIDDSTQMIRLDREKGSLIRAAEEHELEIAEVEKKIRKKQKKEEAEAEAEEEKEEDEASKGKRKKIILIVAALGLIYALLFPSEDKPKKPPFEHLPPQIIFPIPFDVADTKKSQAEFNKGTEFFKLGTYPSLVKAGINYKAAYENNLDNNQALFYMIRVYAEELKHSKNKTADALTIFNVIQSKRPTLMQDPNGVIGLNLFYMAINKPEAAADVVQKYLKLKPENITQDLFAVYLKSLLKLGRVDLARQFYQALEKAPDKNRYAYEALADYLLLNQEPEKALEYVNDGLKNNPQYVPFYLQKAELLFKQKKYKEMLPLLNTAEEKLLDYNDLNRAKFFELTGLLLAVQGDVKMATNFLTRSLRIEDSDTLRMKLADLETTEGKEKEVDNLINESKAIKLLNQAKDFFNKRNYELAMSTAARASDAYPGHIPSELFLAKVQLRLGLASQGLKTLEDLVARYPDDKQINFSLIEAYIDTYKFNDAKNRIAIISTTDLKEGWEYASVNANLYLKMGDFLQSLSWLRTSIGMNPLNDHDIYLLSQLLMKRGNYDAARTLLNKAMELDPVNPDYRIAYANMIYETQDDQAAIGYLLSLLDEFGENPKVLAEIATFYYRAGKVKDFQDYKKKIEKLPFKDKALYKFLIKSAMMDERYMEIPGYVEELLAVEPGELEEMMTAGRVLFEEGKLVDAAKWFKRVQDKLKSYPKVLYYIARIKFLSGDLDGALDEIKSDIKANGENDTSLVFLAQVLAEKGEFIEAENTYKRAQKLNPRSYEALVGLADLSTKRNNFDLALDLYKRAMKQKTDEAIIHKKIGDVYRLLGQGTLAIESYKMYLDMNPEAPDKAQIDSYIQLMQ